MTDIERLSSGVAGLDTVLHGGFPRGGIHLLQGTPGSGKTTLGNQICYHHAAGGGSALFVTLLAESHARMLTHLATMSFFDASQLPEQMSYVSGLGTLEADGLRGLVTLLRREVSARRATVLVLDGLVAAEERATSESEYKKFIQDVQAQAGLYGCTAFLLTTAPGKATPPEHTMVDGIVELTDVRYGSRTERGLFVSKLRGSDYLSGRHPFSITSDGLVVYPRLESAFQHGPDHDDVAPGSVTTGLASLDAMLDGGMPLSTVTGVLGPTGIGKTTLGLHFACAAGPSEPALVFGFYETPGRLQLKADSLGIDLRGAIRRGDVEVLWQPQGEAIQDALAYRLLDAVGQRGVRRLFLDGLDAFIAASIEPARTGRFFASLINELRSRGVTMLYSMETRDVFGPGIEVPVTGVSALVEGLIALRFLEYRSRSRRLLSVLKVRDRAFDPTLREFVIADGRGIRLGDPFEHADELLSGFARERRTRGLPAAEPEAP